MDFFQILLIIIVIVAAAAAVYFVWSRLKEGKDPEYAAKMSKRRAARDLDRQQKKVERAQEKVKRAKFKEATAPARAELVRAKSDYNNNVRKAEDNLRAANHAYEKAVKDQEHVIEDINKKYSAGISNVGSTKLYADRLEIQGTSLKINETYSANLVRGKELIDKQVVFPGFNISQIPEGEKPSAAGSAIGGVGTPAVPWEVGARADYCYLLITGATAEYQGKKLNVCIPLDDRKLDAGSALEKGLNSVAPQAQDNEAKRSRELQEAQNKLESIKADTAAVQNAQTHLENVKADNAAVMYAQAALDEVEKQASEEFGYANKR